MNKNNINYFVKKNFFKIETKNSKKKILLIDRGLAESAIMNSFFAFILNKKYSYNIDLVNNVSKENHLFKIYESFGIKKNINININHNLLRLDLILSSILLFFFDFFKIFIFGRTWFIKNYEVKNIYFGDLIYDEYIRNGHNFLKRNLINYKFLKILFIRIFKIHFLYDLIKKENYNYIFAPTDTYASNSALGLRIALRKKIKVLNILSNRLRIYTKPIQAQRIEFMFDHEFLNDKKIFSKNWKKKFDIMLKERYQGKIKYHTAKDAYYKKKSIDKNEFIEIFKLKKKKFKRVVFFAPHCFSDANHRAGRLIFDDYYAQFQNTIKLAKKDKDSLWIVKIHPQSYKYNEENLIYDLLPKKPKNLVVSPKHISTYSLIKFSDLIITGRGTIGLEASCFGKKPLLAGDSFYSNFGITHDPKNIAEYNLKALNYKLSSKLSKKQIIQAKKLFYLLVFKNSHISCDKILVSNYLKADIKLNRMKQQFLSVDEFLKNLIRKLDSKIDLSKDKIFKHFEEIFIKQG